MFGYDRPLLMPIALNTPFSTLTETSLSGYQMSGNPALYKLNYRDDFSFYTAGFGYQENEYLRIFDPRRQHDYGVSFYAHKILSDNALIAGRADYSQSYLNQVSRSLEKDFYDHYFAYADTTTGNVRYDGPQMWLLYNHQINSLLLGLELSYGIEEGLKDVYTECETVLRNLDITAGLGFISPSEKFTAGLSAKYLSYQGKYEAVKELQDAFVRTYFGYHVFADESPRSTNRKNDYSEGWVLSGQIKFNDILIRGLNVQFSTGYGTKYHDITVGATTTPDDRGYWVRETIRYAGNLSYSSSDAKKMAQLYYENSQTSDWAKSGRFSAIVLENDPVASRFGVNGFVLLNEKTGMSLQTELTAIADDYHEYVRRFDYQKERTAWSAEVGVLQKINVVSSVYGKIAFGTAEPFFYWNTDKISQFGGSLGWEQLTTAGILGLDISLTKISPEDGNLSVMQYGLRLTYKK